MVHRQDLYELEEAFRLMFRKVKASWTRFEAHGVSASQAVILEKLQNEGPLKVSQIADALWITSGAVTSLSDKLISGGFAERTRSEEDRRVVYMEITEKGKEIIEELRLHRQRVVEEYFGKLPDEDIKQLTRICKAILTETQEVNV